MRLVAIELKFGASTIRLERCNTYYRIYIYGLHLEVNPASLASCRVYLDSIKTTTMIHSIKVSI